jgi:small nuclear ribonucleoprotein (snRNP)-like protein
MRTSHILTVLLSAMILSSCNSVSYLPKVEEIDVNRYGSEINVKLKVGRPVKGELIAIDETKLIVLTRSKDQVAPAFVPVQQIKSFRLTYAQSKDYGWSVPVFAGVTAIHGFWLIASLPVNLAVTLTVTALGETAYTYNSKKMPYGKLNMFARFPQGIPPDVSLSALVPGSSADK